MKGIILGLLFVGSTVINFTHAQPNKNNVHEAVEFIISKFENNDIVAIGETHDKVEVTDFYIRLVENIEFGEKVDFIVIEMGNHLFQPVLEDYVNGKNVDKTELYRLWRDHTSCMLNDNDNTGLIRLLDAVRSQNLSSKHKISILAGDPDIDWTKVDCLQQFYKYLGSRSKFYTDIVKHYVVNDNKRGLIIMGNSHFNKQRTESMKKNNLENPITSLIQFEGTKLFLLNIMSSSSFPYEKIENIDTGSIITTNDSWLGNIRAGSPFIKDIPLSMQTDGIIYLGNKSQLTNENITAFNDKSYEQEMVRRKNLENCNK